MGVYATGCGHHLLLAFATESPDGLPKCDICRALPALQRQCLKRGGQAVRGALHQRKG